MEEMDRGTDTTPHRVLSRLAGLVTIASSVFVILGNEPVVEDFFGTSDETLRLQYLLAAADDWDRANTMFAVAGVAIAVGFVLWAVAIHLGRAARTSRRVAAVGATSATLGALAWVAVCYRRATGQPAEVAAGTSGWWLLAWALLVMLAVGLVGWTLRRAGMHVRGWVIIVLAVIFVPIGTILPLVVPFPVALAGLIILVTPSSRWESGVSTTTTDPLMP